MKRKIFGVCLVLLLGYVLATLLNLPTLNVGLLKFRGVCRSCNLTNVNLVAMDLHGADLTAVNLTGANLTNANLTGANFNGAALKRANLSGAIMDGADLYEAVLNDVPTVGTNFAGCIKGYTVFQN